MLTKKMETAINRQINAELYSGYMYLAMSSYFETVNLPGFAAWMKAQAGEELEHAMKMFGYVGERRGTVTLDAIDKPPSKWASPLKAFEAALEHEEKVTGMINTLADLAAAENDHATGVFLQWFIKEQVEEEASADAIVQKLKLAKDASGALLMLDRELGKRGAGGAD
ncbi:MAG: ferritin [Verrucomicrobia bacterium]|nr:ferritin [Verrucomicrobiota bacterium]